MTTPVLAEVVLPALTAMPVDENVNTFAFEWDTAVALDGVGGILSALVAFYNTASGGATHPLSYYLSDELDTGSNKAKVRFYDLTGALGGGPHGSPILVSSWTLGGGAGVSALMPSEVAICLSFHGDLAEPVESGGTRPQSRHRGRVYLGPLSGFTADNVSGTNIVKVKSMARTDACDAMATLAGADLGWSVWSRSNAALDPVIGGFVDDEFDTQRRRRRHADARTTWALP